MFVLCQQIKQTMYSLNNSSTKKDFYSGTFVQSGLKFPENTVKLGYNKFGYNKFGYNKLLVITNK